MSKSNRPIYTRIHASAKTVRDWRGLSNAKAHARKTGAAMALRADGSGIMYFTEEGKLRQRTFADVRPVDA